ncbi:MAG: hypothetical protein CME61_06060 [Halobacteriovoraceae bacterium]|nr:hypothetical protein [Halobacteriovoraceae bacterium]
MSKDKKPKSIEINEKQLEKLKSLSVENPALSEFASNIGSGVVAPLKESAIRKGSHKAMMEQLNIQMAQIMDQIKLLAEQVEDLQKRKEISEEIYLSKITFEPVVGNEYFLYYNNNESRKFLSMIAPGEWGKSGDHLTFISKVQLLGDKTWKVIDLDNNEKIKITGNS